MLKKSSEGNVNDLSKDIIAKLTARKKELGTNIVKYKFNIQRKNPDGYRSTAPEYIYRAWYALEPVTFDIIDDGTPKRIGLFFNEVQIGQTGRFEPDYQRIVLVDRDRGILTLDLTRADDIAKFFYLELHPANMSGLFYDKRYGNLFERVDETKEAKRRVTVRKIAYEAISRAENMTAQEVKNFASAIGWDDSESDEILQDKVQTLAEKDPNFFIKFCDPASITVRAAITRAEKAGIIHWSSTEYKYSWGSTGETIASFGRSDKDKLDLVADWIATQKQGSDAYEKIKGMLKTAKLVV